MGYQTNVRPGPLGRMYRKAVGEALDVGAARLREAEVAIVGLDVLGLTPVMNPGDEEWWG